MAGADELPGLHAAAARRAAAPSYLADSVEEQAIDTRLAELAVTVALRRHGRGGKDLREVALVVGSGGVLRHGDPAARRQILAPALGDFGGGWPVPEKARTVVDASYVLAAAGLLARDHPGAAARLLQNALLTDRP